MNAIKNLAPRLARRVHLPRRGSAEPPAPVLLPAPTFTPMSREIRQTRPIHISNGRHTAHGPGLPRRTPGLPGAIPHRPPADDGTLRRVRDGIRGIPVDAPDPDLSRADRFAADMRMPKRGGLPLFRLVARKRGWCGLNEEHPPESWSPLGAWHLAEQEQDILSAIATGTNTARVEARARQIATEQDWRGTGMSA